MKSKIIFCGAIALILCGCNADLSVDELRNIRPPKEENPYGIELENMSSVENVCVDNLILRCTIGDYDDESITVGREGVTRCFGNCRYCFLFNDGYVYCANLYYDFAPNIEIGTPDIRDDMWSKLQDVYCLGRLSPDELQMVEEWIGKITYADNGEFVKWEKSANDLEESDFYINVYRSDMPETGLNIIKPMWGGIIPRDGLEYYDDIFSEMIIQWVLDSPYIELWDSHISETGQEVWNSYDSELYIENENILVK